MISYIKEYTVEVIKQPAPMYHTHILNDTFVKKPLASLGSSNQKKKKAKSVHKMSSPAVVPKSIAWVKGLK